MTKHTLGPWTANLHHLQDYAGRSHAFIHANKPLVPLAAVVLAAEGTDDAEGRANARLIAAAPDLLKVAESALNAMEVYMTDLNICRSVVPKLRAAITKATSALPGEDHSK